jgi:hypothetical protein
LRIADGADDGTEPCNPASGCASIVVIARSGGLD